MFNFERELYADPDRENLNSLWWDLVERLQLVKRPPERDEPGKERQAREKAEAWSYTREWTSI